MVNMARKLKLVLPLFVVLLVSTDARFPNLGKLFGKLPFNKGDIPSIAEKVISKFPFLKSRAELPKSYAEPSAKKSSPAFCGEHDCPDFYVKVNATDYTLRCYPESYRWVSTSVTGESPKQAGRTAFWRLFKYIQGANEEQMKIKMTVPVTNQIQLDAESESFCKNNFTMSFFIPFKHQKNAPAPSAENVHLTVVKPFCTYVGVYGGWSDMKNVEKRYEDLVEALKRDGLENDFHTDMMYSAGYDGPRKYSNRHNEIWLVSKGQIPALQKSTNIVAKKEEELPKRGFFGKLPFKTTEVHSIAKKVFSKIPFLKSAVEKIKSYAEPSAKESSPAFRFCGKHDCPKFYEIKLNATDYTLRCYPELYRWVSTTGTGESSTAFWRLFKYIQGANEEQMKINMTVPVTKRIQLDTESESFCKNNFSMSFFIPFKHQKNAPAPSAEDVHLTVVKPFCAYVGVYGGWSNMKKVEKRYKDLVNALKRDGLENDFHTDMMYSAGYDDPRKIFNRHNEIWLVSKKQIPKSDIDTL